MKQTVQEVSENYANKTLRGKVNTQLFGDILEAFEAGSIWQKKQGMQWTDINESLPAHDIQHAESIESLEVLVTNGEDLALATATYNKIGQLKGWKWPKFVPTHWTYINNLPKTD